MKKVIFLSYKFMGYEEEIIKLIKNELDYEVYFFNFEDYLYKYKNLFDRINSIFYKIVLKKKIKEIKFNSFILEKIEEIKDFDYIFCIRADKFSEEIFSKLKLKNKKMILHHWDSFSFISEQKKYLKYFDKISSFDKKECYENKMKFIPNFYLKDKIEKANKQRNEYEFFTVMKYDKRFFILEKLAIELYRNKINYKFIVITNENIKSEYIEIRKNKISLEENYEYLSKSNGIVEIGHTKELSEKYQGGASFRIADAIGNKKKIITNYKFIKEYDIYNPNNIYVIDSNNLKLDLNFIKSKYESYEELIYRNYSGEAWIKKIFEEEEE